jgi:hypothetical protein
MKKVGRNDPCPCGSGKKYKDCCLHAADAERAQTPDNGSDGALRAFEWLTNRYGKAVREAINEGFLGTLDSAEQDALQELEFDSFASIMFNAMEWLLAEGRLELGGEERPASTVLLGQGGPLLTVAQRQWLMLLADRPLRLYEVTEVSPGESMRLRDLTFADSAPVVVREKSGSEQMVPCDVIAGRVLPIADHFELSGAVYAIPRHRALDLLVDLHRELEGVAPDSPEGREIPSVIIRDCWLRWFVQPFQAPTLIDRSTGDPMLFVTDHYQVRDWDTLEAVLSQQADIEGSRQEGWHRLFTSEDGQTRNRLVLEAGDRPDRLKAFYRTQRYADEGRPWLAETAGDALVFLSREISDPVGRLQHPKPGAPLKPAPPPPDLPPEAVAQALGQHVRTMYANWADAPLPVLDGKTPREAIQTRQGLEQVKFLLHTYEHGERTQAENQHRPAVSYDFLWRELGISHK